jgi:hypothetical protein
MLSSPNVSSLSVITNIRNAVALAKQENQPMQVDIAGVQLTVKPNSDPSELVCLWETEFEKREK